MGIASIVIGIAALVMYLVTLVPHLHWLNIVVIPLGIVGAIIAGTNFKGTNAQSWERKAAYIGLILNLLVIILGIRKLF